MQDQSALNSTPSYVDAYTPPTPPAPQAVTPPSLSATPPLSPASPSSPLSSSQTQPLAPSPMVNTQASPDVLSDDRLSALTPHPTGLNMPAPSSIPPAAAPLNAPPANDPQLALDELSKMFDQDTVEPEVGEKPLNISPTMPPVMPPMESADQTVSPVMSQTATPQPATPSSEDLLADIESALKAEKSQPITPTPVLPPTPPIMDHPADALPVAAGLESEKLEDQNIFHLLGVDTSSQEQKDQFLDELQQVIWEDFIDHDIELLLTDKELQELKTTHQLDAKKPLVEQEAVIIYLEKLIPDLENLMLEKAIKLKADLVKERVTTLRGKLVGQTDKLAELDQAEGLINQEKWFSAAKILNKLGS